MRLRGLDLHQVQFTIHFVETAATVGAPYIAILPIWIINFNNEFLSSSPSERCTPRRTPLLNRLGSLIPRERGSGWGKLLPRTFDVKPLLSDTFLIGEGGNERSSRSRPQLFWYIPDPHFKPAWKSITRLFKESSSTRYVMLFVAMLSVARDL